MAKIFDANHLQRLLNEYLKRKELAFLGFKIGTKFYSNEILPA